MVMEEKLKVQIKGIKDGLLVTLADGDWEDAQADLIRHISEKENFFKGAKIALEVGNHVLNTSTMLRLRDQLSERGITLWAVLSNSPLTEETSKTLGLLTRLPMGRAESGPKPIDTVLAGEHAVLVQRTLRSGFQVTYQGHVVVIGDVNPGAEIIASGSVVVWGRLRGVVHAGAEGEEKATVCALDLSPTQLRIASLVAVTPARKGKSQPEMASVKNGQVIAEVWEHKEGGK